jgi:uncharacterized LabA/DUF88 family protein
MPTAILVDGGFFLKRFRHVYRDKDGSDPSVVAKALHAMALAHLKWKDEPKRELYRILFYDCPPSQTKAHRPITNAAIDFAKTPEAAFRLRFHDLLRRSRKVALRLGYLCDDGWWKISERKLKALCRRQIKVEELADEDFSPGMRQKGVDMKIGIDIASIAYKRLADQIIFISGDADFVPAAKLARREGIDFVLDPMWNQIQPTLNEHVDGIRSTCPRPASHVVSAVVPAGTQT